MMIRNRMSRGTKEQGRASIKQHPVRLVRKQVPSVPAKTAEWWARCKRKCWSVNALRDAGTPS